MMAEGIAETLQMTVTGDLSSLTDGGAAEQCVIAHIQLLLTAEFAQADAMTLAEYPLHGGWVTVAVGGDIFNRQLCIRLQ